MQTPFRPLHLRKLNDSDQRHHVCALQSKGPRKESYPAEVQTLTHSRCIYQGYPTAIHNKLIKTIDQIHFHYIWINKLYYMINAFVIYSFDKRDTIMSNYNTTITIITNTRYPDIKSNM